MTQPGRMTVSGRRAGDQESQRRQLEQGLGMRTGKESGH